MSTETETQTITPVATRHPDTVPIEHQYEVALINEECGEVCQIVGKTLRFGWSSQHPETGEFNFDLLHYEMGDVLAAVDFGIERGAFDKTKIEKGRREKLAKLRSVAPPPMYVTRGSTIALHRPQVNESSAAIWVLLILFCVVAVVGWAFYGLGKSHQREVEVIRTEAAVEKVEERSDALADCYAKQIGKIDVGSKNAKPADLSVCDTLVKK